MTLDELETMSSQIHEFSLLHDIVQELSPPIDTSSFDFHDVLLSLASRLRQRDLAYHLEYARPDQPVFRLRSDRSLPEDAPEKRFNYREPGRWLLFRLEPPGEDTIEGISDELKVLGELDQDEEGMTRESRLNLLVSRTFHAELYAEYQRWKRYGSPLLVVVVVIDEDHDWKPAARALKHVCRTRDMVGRLRVDRLSAFFPSCLEPETIKQDIRKRMTGAYSEGGSDHSFYLLPEDVDDWNTLKNHVFEPLTPLRVPEETVS